MDPYLAARVGDLVGIQQWAEANKANINDVDEHERSVLYYAGLCGKEEIVKYLLSIGATVGRNDAISALTDTIRLMLERNDANIVQRQPTESCAASVTNGDCSSEYASLAQEGFYAH